MELDALLPDGCAPSVRPFLPYWPRPGAVVALQWHQASLSTHGGKADDGMRTAGSLKALRGAAFHDHREHGVENPHLVVQPDSKLAVVPGSAPSDSVGNTMFAKGLTNILGVLAAKAFPLPPSVARAIERDFYGIAQSARGVWERYMAVAAAFVSDLMYAAFLRGNEPWKMLWSKFGQQPYLRQLCPLCGHNHLNVFFGGEGELTKTSDKQVDIVIAAPVTGSGLRIQLMAERLLELRAMVDKLLRARGIRTDYLFVTRAGAPWANQDFMKDWGLPAMQRLRQEGHPGLAGIDLGDMRRVGIRMWRRGGEMDAIKRGVLPDLIDLMGRWRPKLAQKEPSIMRQRYYTMRCEDGVKITKKTGARVACGFCAIYPFENVELPVYEE
jgi:hypothetical protein